MNQIDQFKYLERYAPSTLDDRLARERTRHQEILRDCMAHNLKRAFDYAEAALDHERDLRQTGYDTREELKEARTTTEALLLMIMGAQHEQGVE